MFSVMSTGVHLWLHQRRATDKNIMKIHLWTCICRDDLERQGEAKTNIMVGKIQHVILSVITKRIYIQTKLIYIWPL